MPNPPKGDRSDLFLKILESPRPTEVVDFPRKGLDGKYIGQLRFRVLHWREIREARLKAVDTLAKKYKVNPELHDHRGYRDTLQDMISCEILVRAALEVDPYNDDPESPKYRSVFGSVDDLDHLTGDEIAILYAGHVMLQDKAGPHEGNLYDESQITAWVKALEEGARSFPLSHLSSHQRVTLTTLLAQRASALSEILECLTPKLPDSLAAELLTLGIGTGLFGRRVATSTDSLPIEGLTIDEAGELIAQHTGEERFDSGPIAIDEMKSFADRVSGENYDDPDFDEED